MREINRSGASIATPDDVSALSLAAPPDTYKYRNVEQRRAYMRDLMRKRREAKSN